MKIIIIAAIAENGVIGKSGNSLPWHVPEDFKHFKATTRGYPIIMGRKTYESLGKPLKERTNIVVTTKENYGGDYNNLVVKHSLDEALEFGKSLDKEKLFIGGGAKIYKQCLDRGIVDEMIISHMKFKAEGDVYFPAYDEDDFAVEDREDREKFEIVRYRKKKENG